MKAVWQYIKKHHEEYGVALFVVPALLVVFALISIGYGLAWLFQ
jgi:hypothetical protein